MVAQRFAVMADTKVDNIILLDEEDIYETPAGTTLIPIDEEVSIDWELVDGTWTAPPSLEPPEPEPDPVVDAAKQKALGQLMALGITEDVARTIVGLPPA